MPKKKRTFEDLVADIDNQIDRDEEIQLTGDYSHNIIGCLLRVIDRDYGTEKAKLAMRRTNLNLLGWNIPE